MTYFDKSCHIVTESIKCPKATFLFVKAFKEFFDIRTFAH